MTMEPDAPLFLTGEEREHHLRQSDAFIFILDPGWFEKTQGREDLRIAIDQGLPIVCEYPVVPGQPPLYKPQAFIEYRGPKLFLKYLYSVGPTRKDLYRLARFLRANGVPPELLQLFGAPYR